MLKGGHDTLVGIVHWWMLEQNIKTETAKVKEALDHLVNEGFVVELQGKDSRAHYRINQSMRKKIAKLLKDASEDT
jgi:Fe2+ or Zn2+ uptake regulation protein